MIDVSVSGGANSTGFDVLWVLRRAESPISARLRATAEFSGAPQRPAPGPALFPKARELVASVNLEDAVSDAKHRPVGGAGTLEVSSRASQVSLLAQSGR